MAFSPLPRTNILLTVQAAKNAPQSTNVLEDFRLNAMPPLEHISAKHDKSSGTHLYSVPEISRQPFRYSERTFLRLRPTLPSISLSHRFYQNVLLLC